MGSKSVPEVRFKGFSGEWDECKIVDVLNINSGRDYKHLKKGDIPVYGTGGYMHSVNDKLSDDDAIGIGRKGTINKPQLLLAPFWTVDTLFYMTVKGKNDLYFLYSLANRIDWKKYDESTGVPSLSKNSIYKISINVPLLREQTQIGNFFKQLDETIAFQQQELDTLKQTKQGFLQKMFPKEGESVPEIRFPGFNGEWEKKRLKDLATFAKGIGYSKSDIVEEGDPIILYGSLYTKYQTVIEEVDTFTKIKEKSLISKGYEVIVPSSGETSEDIARASVVKRPGIILGGDLNVIYPCDDINSIFLALTISNGKQQKELSRKAQGKSVVHLHNSDLKEVNLYYPKREEQTQIASFFKQLDKTIALCEQEIDILKQTKKAFLQKMFL
ncbi:MULTISPECIES: restriction endonuclease subunit S [Bacillus]|uniref:restriction endonuclease subunit S n=1 Tax=Bacillus TaxID=1386 RepID=UPI0021132697|nr:MULTISPECIES: restriction endonuclease subunit S [Bacillus]MED1748195.1 restriction endonuclease subunit S [Bacillus zhangzhouensis]UUD41776.1 restriction endonuclease subunit S [Bacillus pumilus]